MLQTETTVHTDSYIRFDWSPRGKCTNLTFSKSSHYWWTERTHLHLNLVTEPLSKISSHTPRSPLLLLLPAFQFSSGHSCPCSCSSFPWKIIYFNFFFTLYNNKGAGAAAALLLLFLWSRLGGYVWIDENVSRGQRQLIICSNLLRLLLLLRSLLPPPRLSIASSSWSWGECVFALLVT